MYFATIKKNILSCRNTYLKMFPLMPRMGNANTFTLFLLVELFPALHFSTLPFSRARLHGVERKENWGKCDLAASTILPTVLLLFAWCILCSFYVPVTQLFFFSYT